MKTVPILFSFDDRMLMPAVVCMTSLLENAAPETFYDIIILHRPEFDFSGTALAELPRRYPRCKMTFRKVGDDFLGAYEIRGISVETYFRLLASELIPEYDKILYSDVDVIFREDLGRYYDLDLGDCYFAGVDNGSALRPGVRVHLDEIGLDYRKGYYYAGNIVMNLAQIRKDGMIDVFKELGKKNPKRFFTIGIVDDVTNLSLEENKNCQLSEYLSASVAETRNIPRTSLLGSSHLPAAII